MHTHIPNFFRPDPIDFIVPKGTKERWRPWDTSDFRRPFRTQRALAGFPATAWLANIRLSLAGQTRRSADSPVRPFHRERECFVHWWRKNVEHTFCPRNNWRLLRRSKGN